MAKLAQDSSYPGIILSRSNSRHKVTRNVPGEETPLGSSETFTPTRRARYPFVATVKATDAVSGMQLAGLTTDLSEGGSHIDAKMAILRRDTDSAGNHEEWRCVTNGRHCDLQPEGPIHGSFFRGDAA